MIDESYIEEKKTETPFSEALRAFVAGKATKAYAVFLSDPTSNPNTSFKAFCLGMNRVLAGQDRAQRSIMVTNTPDREIANMIITKAHRNGQGNGVLLETLENGDFRVTIVS